MKSKKSCAKECITAQVNSCKRAEHDFANKKENKKKKTLRKICRFNGKGFVAEKRL